MGWAGSDVRVKGLALGEPYHGFVLVSTTCDRAIKLDITDEAIVSALAQGNSTGLVSLDVSGKFFARASARQDERQRGHLLVKAIGSVDVMPMSERARQVYWDARLQHRNAALGQ
jgi:hypothetical protein